MDKLTILSFEKLFDQLTYEDGEKFLMNRLKQMVEKNVFIVQDLSYPFKVTLVYSEDKRDVMKKYFRHRGVEMEAIFFYNYNTCRICTKIVSDKTSHLRNHSEDDLVKIVRQNYFINITEKAFIN